MGTPDLEDGQATVGVRSPDADLAVEATGTHEGRVQQVCSVGGSDEDDALIGCEAIHLTQQLVQGLLSFLIRPLACTCHAVAVYIQEAGGRQGATA